MLKKSFSLVFTAFALATLMMPIAETFAQGGRGGQGGHGGHGFGGPRDVSSAGLLRVEKVREELEITEEQAEAIKTAMEEIRGDRGPDRDRPNFRDMSDEERQTYMKKMRAEMEERGKKVKEKLGTILLPPQMDRLNQITLQVQGVGALRSKAVAEKLGLSEEQANAIKKSMDEATQGIREQMREMFQNGGGGDMQAMREKMQQLRKEVEEKALAHLNDDQKKSFEALKGEKFDMPERAFRGRGRGGRGGERGRGGREGRGGRGGRGGEGGRGRGGERPDRPQRPEIE